MGKVEKENVRGNSIMRMYQRVVRETSLKCHEVRHSKEDAVGGVGKKELLPAPSEKN